MILTRTPWNLITDWSMKIRSRRISGIFSNIFFLLLSWIANSYFDWHDNGALMEHFWHKMIHLGLKFAISTSEWTLMQHFWHKVLHLIREQNLDSIFRMSTFTKQDGLEVPHSKSQLQSGVYSTRKIYPEGGWV